MTVLEELKMWLEARLKDDSFFENGVEHVNDVLKEILNKIQELEAEGKENEG